MLNTKITQRPETCPGNPASLDRALEDDLHAVANGCVRTQAGTARTWKRMVVMAWIYLVVAGLFEIGWAIGLKYTDGFTRLTPSVLTGASMVISVLVLGLALRELPVGSAYAVWTGIGTVGTALLGMYLFGEPATVIRLVCIGLIVSGIAGLKFLA